MSLLGRGWTQLIGDKLLPWHQDKWYSRHCGAPPTPQGTGSQCPFSAELPFTMGATPREAVCPVSHHHGSHDHCLTNIKGQALAFSCGLHSRTLSPWIQD